ncbi:MAG: hypothetical protein K9N23_13840 [Akkermansiaceae bacterium]|nr:hypothetical protein [Akkermansiaceae bacterium]
MPRSNWTNPRPPQGCCARSPPRPSPNRPVGNITLTETTRDTASHFFIDALPAGTHVFETGVRIQHAGIYQTGIATIRCMYTPAFAAHSGSVPVTAE